MHHSTHTAYNSYQQLAHADSPTGSTAESKDSKFGIKASPGLQGIIRFYSEVSVFCWPEVTCNLKKIVLNIFSYNQYGGVLTTSSHFSLN